MTDAAQILRQVYGGQAWGLHGGGAAAQNAAPAETGSAMGLSFAVMEDPGQEFQDSLEELSMMFEEKSLKRTAERKLGEGRRANSFIEAIQTWQKLFPDMPGGAYAERMLRTLRNMAMQGREGAMAGELAKMLGEGSADPSHRYALLDAMEKALGEGEAALRAALAEAKRGLEAEKGPEIRAGINLAEEINSRAGSAEEMKGLRETYRAQVLGFTTPQACFRALLAQKGAGRMGEALDFLVKGCGIELQSASPSRSPEELRRILGDLQCAIVLKTAMDRLGGLAGKMAPQFGERCLLGGEALAERVLGFTERSAAPGDVAALVADCGIAKLLAQIYFCTGLIDIFRQLSPKLFADESGRFALEDAAQEHLDGLVERQEAEDGGEGGDAA